MVEHVIQFSEFEPYLNKSFTIWVEEGKGLSAELIEADLLTKVYVLEDSPRKAFSLVFKLEEGGELGQGMYKVNQEDTTWENIFLVPIIMPRMGRFVQAVFN